MKMNFILFGIVKFDYAIGACGYHFTKYHFVILVVVLQYSNIGINDKC